MSLGWPASLRVIRHAESVGNVDSERARREGLEMWSTPERDPDVGLTAAGREQAAELGSALAGIPEGDARCAVWSSPFLRATETAKVALACAGGSLAAAPWTIDERLRDRELGVLDRLTWRGTQTRHPELADLRRRFGKFYFRPPGGESWADVALRTRAVLRDLRDSHVDDHVVIFAHDVVVLMLRYVIEGMDEAAVLDVGRHDPVHNCGITTYRKVNGVLVLESYNRLPPSSGQVDESDRYSARGSGR